MVRVEGLRKSYGAVEAVRGVVAGGRIAARSWC